jgi:hypothetical protein
MNSSTNTKQFQMISKLILAQQVTVQDRIIIQLYIHVEPVTIQLLRMIKELFVIHGYKILFTTRWKYKHSMGLHYLLVSKLFNI